MPFLARKFKCVPFIYRLIFWVVPSIPLTNLGMRDLTSWFSSVSPGFYPYSSYRNVIVVSSTLSETTFSLQPMHQLKKNEPEKYCSTIYTLVLIFRSDYVFFKRQQPSNFYIHSFFLLFRLKYLFPKWYLSSCWCGFWLGLPMWYYTVGSCFLSPTVWVRKWPSLPPYFVNRVRLSILYSTVSGIHSMCLKISFGKEGRKQLLLTLGKYKVLKTNENVSL